MNQKLFDYAPVIAVILSVIISILELLTNAFSFYGPFRVNWFLWSLAVLIRLTAFVTIGALIRKLNRGCRTDSLTGLSNRKDFYDKLQLEIERSKRIRTQLSLIMIDIDDFKKVNDQHGHAAGDKVLKHLASVLKKSIRNIDTVARWGGEEFAVILPCTGMQGALALAERLRISVETVRFPWKITISQGVISSSDNINDIDIYVTLADNALYKAKEKKNTIEVAS